ncbi:lysozyme C [Mytilus galloprovincialis]|uniref:lysozyme n=1 Tax=Mytilus galloprovincialis TaxID=29158 RepID=A0A8B6E4B0_MYTGA|nr:lysozyme C [Mytilus galloprovincialis]
MRELASKRMRELASKRVSVQESARVSEQESMSVSEYKRLCLVKHESNYRYDVVGTNSNGSKDYGIFQMNSNYFCGRPSGTSSSTCWRVNTYGCADSCTSFTNSDISNDANCAVRVKNCGGFGKWYGWRNHCSNVQGSEYDYSTC